jgi:hypothetical protein
MGEGNLLGGLEIQIFLWHTSIAGEKETCNKEVRGG